MKFFKKLIISSPYIDVNINDVDVLSVSTEKFHSIVSRGIVNSRIKDFYDIWVLQKQMIFEGPSLLEAICKTFSNRNTKLNGDSIVELKLLGEVPEKGKQWEQFVRKNQFESKTPSFQEIISSISSFLSPLVMASDVKMPPPNM